MNMLIIKWRGIKKRKKCMGCVRVCAQQLGIEWPAEWPLEKEEGIS